MRSSVCFLVTDILRIYVEFHSIELLWKYTCTNYYQNTLETETAKRTVQLTSLYSFNTPYSTVSNI
jgi:hypothetical protein